MRLRRLASAFATIALLANLLAAALPLGARASAWPTTIVVCTAHGPVTVAASDLGEESPAAPSEHDCCSLCRLASDAPALPVPAPVVDRVPARDTASPPLAAAPASADSPTRRARAPPAAT